MINQCGSDFPSVIANICCCGFVIAGRMSQYEAGKGCRHREEIPALHYLQCPELVIPSIIRAYTTYISD